MNRAPHEFDPAASAEHTQDGSRAGEAGIVARFLPRIRTFIAVRTSDSDAVEELSQEIMLAVLCALREDRLRDPDSLSAFVFGIARNLLNDYIRKRIRSKTEQLSGDFPAPGPSLRASEQYLQAQREIEKLDPTDRKVLTMTLVDGLKPGEIADALGLSPEVVRQRKSRALKRLLARCNPPSRKTSERLLPL